MPTALRRSQAEVDVEVDADMVEEKLEEEEEVEEEEEEAEEEEEKEDEENSSDKIKKPSPGRWGTKKLCCDLRRYLLQTFLPGHQLLPVAGK